jgi:NitT/TauT family transport system ATP-binding protein
MPAGLPSGADGRSSLAARPPAIRAAGVDVAFQGPAGIHKVLAGLDIEVADGELLTIIGPSGCGKSTLLRVIADLLDPAAGAIEVFGQPPASARSPTTRRIQPTTPATSASSSRIRRCCPGER